MSKYFIRYNASTTFSFGHRKEHAFRTIKEMGFSLPSQELIAYELLTDINHGVAFSGLGFDGYIEGTTPDEAIARMANSIKMLLLLFSYISLAPYDLNQVNLIMAYEADPEIKERNYDYYTSSTIADDIGKGIRIIDIDRFKAVWNNGDNSALTLNVLNSMYQLNRSLQDNTIQDEFLDLWNGIEYLADKINLNYEKQERKKYITCRKCGIELQKCPHCNHEFKDEAKSSGRFDGIRILAKEKLNFSKKKFDKFHKVRSKLLHNGILSDELQEYTPLLRNLLICVIGSAINLPDQYTQEILNLKPIKIKQIMQDGQLIYKSVLRGLDSLPALEKIDSQPRIFYETPNIKKSYFMEEDGTVTQKSELNLKFSAPTGVTFNNIASEIWISKDSTAVNPKIDFKR